MSPYPNNLILRRPTIEDKDSILDMIDEYFKNDSPTAGLWNFSHSDFSFEDWLEANQLQEAGLFGKGVPAIQLVAFDDNQQAFGFLNIRLRLNDELLLKGGHIGYSVRPSKRNQGIAKKMLKAAIEIAKTKNIRDILVTCHQDNLASRAVIIANGGLLENVVNETERYWIRNDE
ncbi:GNAT family N-acetyltransferase [Streptococcus pluranimalium]